jgi:hypothetical protein
MLGLGLIALRISRAVTCSCSKEQTERTVYGVVSLLNRRYIPILAIHSALRANPLQACLLSRSAHIRASLFNYQLPFDFAATWLRERLFEQKPKSFPIPVAPTRAFCVALFTTKIEATIRNIGDMIGWESDNNTVGPIAVAAKKSLLRFIPHMLPANGIETSLYRLVLDHGDFGIHNMLINITQRVNHL